MRCESCGDNVALQAITPRNSARIVRLCASCIVIMRTRRIKRILASVDCTALFGGAGAHGFVYARCNATLTRRCLGTFDAIALMSEVELCALVHARFSLTVVK